MHVVVICFSMSWFYRGCMTSNAKAKYGPLLLPLAAFIYGAWLDSSYLPSTMRNMHNRSALFGGRDLKPGEKLW